MTERAIEIIVKPGEKRCSNCFFGHQIVAGVSGGRIEDDGTETSWRLARTIPVGQTRNCFSRWQKLTGQAGEKFIYPNEDDTCIDPKKFKLKQIQT